MTDNKEGNLKKRTQESLSCVSQSLRKGIKGQKGGKKSELGKITKELSNVRNDNATWTAKTFRKIKTKARKTTRKNDDFKERN